MPAEILQNKMRCRYLHHDDLPKCREIIFQVLFTCFPRQPEDNEIWGLLKSPFHFHSWGSIYLIHLSFVICGEQKNIRHVRGNEDKWCKQMKLQPPWAFYHLVVTATPQRPRDNTWPKVRTSTLTPYLTGEHLSPCAPTGCFKRPERPFRGTRLQGFS